MASCKIHIFLGETCFCFWTTPETFEFEDIENDQRLHINGFEQRIARQRLHEHITTQTMEAVFKWSNVITRYYAAVRAPMDWLGSRRVMCVFS
jgi:hypothetical protein